MVDIDYSGEIVFLVIKIVIVARDCADCDFKKFKKSFKSFWKFNKKFQNIIDKIFVQLRVILEKILPFIKLF